jgi:hypothetical protein
MAGFLPFRCAVVVYSLPAQKKIPFPLPFRQCEMLNCEQLHKILGHIGSAIYIELYYVFASVWGHQLYSLYGVCPSPCAVLIRAGCGVERQA